MIDISFGSFNSIEALADWVELSVTINNSVSKAELIHYLQNENISEENSEDRVNFVWNALEKRNDRYSSIPPLIISDVDVESNINWVDYPEYVLMLILSLVGNEWEKLRTGIIFERLCSEALKNYLACDTLVVGHSNTITTKELSEILNQRWASEFLSVYNDRKLDVIGWKEIDDRKNKLIILMQCASGNNWKSKTYELQLDVWRNYILFNAKPIKAFGFTKSLLNDAYFEDKGYEGGIIFDRTRIYKHTVDKDFTDSMLRTEIVEWCNERIRMLTE